MKGEPQIIFQDETIIVIAKPSGITVNRSDTTAKEMTVQDWIEKETSLRAIAKQSRKFLQSSTGLPRHYVPRNDEIESDFYKRSGIVHRLDKETSGILLAAKTQVAFEDLQRQFKERVVEKSYVALVHGKLVPPEGEISVPVGRLEYNRKRFGVVAGGRESVTKYKVMQNYELRSKNYGEVVSLVELYPKTGRTHQIRVHMKYLNHPIVSDELYGGRKTARNDRKLLPRLFLHAAKISFIHPDTKEKVSFESPLHEDLQNFLDSLLLI